MQEVGLRILLVHGSCARPKSEQGLSKRVAWEGQPCDDLRDEAQLGVQTPREDCTAVRSRISSIKTIRLPDMRNVVHSLCATEPSGAGTTGVGQGAKR